VGEPRGGGARARPGDAETHWRLGHALLHLVGRPAEAVGPLQEAIRLRPDLVAAHGELGTALALLGRTSEAVAAFEEAVRLDPARAGGPAGAAADPRGGGAG